MQKVNRLQYRWRNVVFALVALLIFLADQISKVWIRATLASGQSLFDIGLLRITHVQNTGAAFSLFPDQTFTLTIVALIGAIALLLCGIFTQRCLPFMNGMLGKSVLGLILGGTVGNLIDRLRFGYVTDFIDFKVWPVFNVADSAVTVGVIMFAYFIIRFTRSAKR
ncbi:signal peptidase II [Chloroflexota bacterium]